MLALLSLLLSWIIALAAWLPIGYWLIRKLNLNSELEAVNRFILATIAGGAVTSSVLGTISLFSPITVTISLVIAICALALFRVALTEEFKLLIVNLKNWSIFNCAVMLMLVGFAIYTSLLPSLNNDSGLYYIQFIKWIQTYPVVPGLANLHERFGFNSNWHLLSAAYDLKPIGLTTTNDLNALLFAVVGFGFVNATSKTPNNYSGVWTIGGITLFLLLRFLTSTAPDLAATLIPFVYLSYLVTQKEEASLPLLILLIAFAATIKLLSVLHIIAILPVVYWVFKNKKYSDLIVTVLLGLVITVPWCARNVIQTGYLVFPLESIDVFNFDWKVPLEISENTRRMVTTHARMGTYDLSTYDLPFSGWFSTWLSVQSKTVLVFFALAITGSIGMAFHSLITLLKRRSNYSATIQLFLSITLIVSVLFWWHSGPNPRFIYGIVLFSCTYVLARIIELFDAKKITRFIPALALLPLALMIRTISSETPPKKPTEYKSFITENSAIYYPENTDKCWDKELPCSNKYQSNLETRGADLKDGFRSKSK